LCSPLNPRILIVDSSSTDSTVATAQSLGAETIVIPRKDFNHGATREYARKILNTDIIVMLTPDVIAIDEHVLEKLVQPILDNLAVVSYARQIPHDEAGIFEAYPRKFNYPLESHLRSIQDLDKYGVYTFFCSDSCAAYLNRALDEIGGFETILFGEDTVATAKLLYKNYSVAYVAEAVVKHSHKYSLCQEFCRHFDIGFMRYQYKELIHAKTTDSSRGKEYVRQLFKQLVAESPYLIPYACLQSLVKWAGYRLGQRSINAPIWFKKRMSSQPYFWTSDHYKYTSKKIIPFMRTK